MADCPNPFVPTPSLQRKYMTGAIVLWSGAIVDIPDGWVICDGNNGTPDLRDRFIVGAGDTYAVDAVGGAVTHGHTFTSDGHTHDIPAGANIAAGANFNDTSNQSQATGTTQPTSSLPKYYALAFIMKL